MNENKLDSVTKITAILTCLSLVIGIVIGLIQIRESISMANVTLEKANQTLDAIKVEALSNVMDILDINSKIKILQAKYDARRLNEDITKVNALLNAGKTGEQIYYSEEVDDFRKIASHYERLSILIQLKYVEFCVIYNVIAFPDNFWLESQELRNLIALNWYGKERHLKDFLSGFENLFNEYKDERKNKSKNCENQLQI